MKETATLHKVLSRYLTTSVVEVSLEITASCISLTSVFVQYVMSQVFAAINHRLSEEYTKIELPSLEAKNR